MQAFVAATGSELKTGTMNMLNMMTEVCNTTPVYGKPFLKYINQNTYMFAGRWGSSFFSFHPFLNLPSFVSRTVIRLNHIDAKTHLDS